MRTEKRKFYLHTRNGVFYAELLTLDGVKLTARSTGKTIRDEALLVVADWLKDGLPVVKPRGYLAEPGGSKNKPISIVADRAGIISAIKKAILLGVIQRRKRQVPSSRIDQETNRG